MRKIPGIRSRLSPFGLRLSITPFLCVLVGCGGDDEADGGRAGKTISAGDYAVRVDTQKKTIELERGGSRLLELPVDAFVLGTVDEVLDSANYDPAPLLAGDATAKEPSGLAWRPATGMKVEQSSSESLTVALAHDGELASMLTIATNGEGSFRASFQPSAEVTTVAYLRVSPRVTDDEAFYGLGEYFDSVNHRGKFRAMQLEISPVLESGYNEAHVPVPFVTSTKAWGLFVENPYPASFDVALADPERIAATFGTGLASKDGLVFHLFAAEHPLDVTKRYYDVSGYPALPARWGLGPLVWRDENDDQAQVEADLKTMRSLDLATSAVWIDRPYATGVNTFDFDATKFPNPQAMIDLAHSLGFRMALWHTPYEDENDPSTQALRDEAKGKGYYPPTRGILLNKWGAPIDFTNEAAMEWWRSHVEKYTAMGIEGFKLDYGEDVVPGAFGARNVWKFADGSDERTMHARYQLFYHRTYSELFPEEGAFLLCRGGTYGDQKHVSVIWPGDLDASFAKQGEEVTEKGETYVAVGGLPGALIAGLSLGPSGFPFFGADTGGYQHSPPDKELFTRWFQVTALSTVMQIGTSTNDVAWEPTTGNGFDAQMLDWYRTYTRLHLRLFPYIWSYAKRLKEDGRPIQRALGLAHPELGVHPDDTFLLGDHLLAAPVVERGKTTRDVTLPSGKWIDWWTGASYDGGKTVTRDAPLAVLPLFIRSGGIVPLLRPTIDTMSPTTDTSVDSYATSAGVLWARVAPGAKSSFVLFDGAELGQSDSASTLELTTKDGSEFNSGVVFEVWGFGAEPKSVDDGGSALAKLADAAALETAPSGYVFSSENGGSLWVKVGPGTHRIAVSR